MVMKIVIVIIVVIIVIVMTQSRVVGAICSKQLCFWSSLCGSAGPLSSESRGTPDDSSTGYERSAGGADPDLNMVAVAVVAVAAVVVVVVVVVGHSRLLSRSQCSLQTWRAMQQRL